MKRFTNPLDNVKVASPCSANWDEMIGSRSQRFCAKCNLNVYNLSEMTRAEAERLIVNTEDRLCARFYRRKDGTIITRNCPVGWAAAKQRMSKLWTAFASIIITMFAGIGITSILGANSDSGGTCEIPRYQPNDRPERVMGVVAIKEYPPEMGDVAFFDGEARKE